MVGRCSGWLMLRFFAGGAKTELRDHLLWDSGPLLWHISLGIVHLVLLLEAAWWVATLV